MAEFVEYSIIKQKHIKLFIEYKEKGLKGWIREENITIGRKEKGRGEEIQHIFISLHYLLFLCLLSVCFLLVEEQKVRILMPKESG